MACPKVYPKLSNARSPCSRSSAATTSALFLHARITASLIAVASRAKIAAAFASIQSKIGVANQAIFDGFGDATSQLPFIQV